MLNMEYCNSGPSLTSTLSRTEKALVKRNVNRAALSNTLDPQFTEDSATQDSAKNKRAKNQPRGYAFWAIVFALFVIALANFFLTVTIYSVLKLTKSMESIEVVPTAKLIKFFGELEVNKVIKANGLISGFGDTPVTFTTVDSDLKLEVHSDYEPEIKIAQEKVELLNVESFEIFEPRSTVDASKTSAFSTTFPNFGLPKGVQSLHIKKASANRVLSKLDSSLVLRSDKSIRIKGNEGIGARGRELLFRADQDVLLRSVNGSVILDGIEGVVFDVDGMEVIDKVEENTDSKIPQYKLCICMPSGSLFRIPVLEGTDSIHCDSVDLEGEDSPCY